MPSRGWNGRSRNSGILWEALRFRVCTGKGKRCEGLQFDHGAHFIVVMNIYLMSTLSEAQYEALEPNCWLPVLIGLVIPTGANTRKPKNTVCHGKPIPILAILKRQPHIQWRKGRIHGTNPGLV